MSSDDFRFPDEIYDSARRIAGDRWNPLAEAVVQRVGYIPWIEDDGTVVIPFQSLPLDSVVDELRATGLAGEVDEANIRIIVRGEV